MDENWKANLYIGRDRVQAARQEAQRRQDEVERQRREEYKATKIAHMNAILSILGIPSQADGPEWVSPDGLYCFHDPEVYHVQAPGRPYPVDTEEIDTWRVNITMVKQPADLALAEWYSQEADGSYEWDEIRSAADVHSAYWPDLRANAFRGWKHDVCQAEVADILDSRLPQAVERWRADLHLLREVWEAHKERDAQVAEAQRLAEQQRQQYLNSWRGRLATWWQAHKPQRRAVPVQDIGCDYNF